MLQNFKAICQVMKDGKLPRSKIDQLIRERLRNVLTSAYRFVPYYRDIMLKIGYNPLRDYSGTEDLLLFPITTKKILKQKGIAAFTKPGVDLSKCHSETTSGSTGIPLKIYQAPYERSITIAKWLRVLLMNGYSLRQKVLEFSGAKNLTDGKSILQHLGFLRKLHLDCLLPMEQLTDKLLEYQPDVLYCMAHNIELLARELEKRGTKLNRLKLVIGYGEIIYERTRQLCREYLGTELIENYGSVEMGAMAYETPKHDGLHLCEDLTYFEFLNDIDNPVEPGEPGRVIVTDLTNMLMPFIRYDQGDLATFQYIKDDDGNTCRRLTQIIGRDDDYVIMPDGSKRRHRMFNAVLNKYKDINQFRIIQRSLYNFEIFIAADETYLAAIRDEVLQKMRKYFPPRVKFEINHVDYIKPDPSGKLRKFISEVRTE